MFYFPISGFIFCKLEGPVTTLNFYFSVPYQSPVGDTFFLEHLFATHRETFQGHHEGKKWNKKRNLSIVF